MKKALMIFFMLVIVFVFWGCNNEKTGNFYTLREAYDKGLLLKEDLENIAYYYNESEINNYNPIPKTPAVIDKNTEKIIKEMYLEKILNNKNISVNLVNLYKYYGTYNGSIALSITDDYYVYDYVCQDEYIIDGIIFYNFHEASIRIFTFDERK